jgi:acyl-CoA synthetase (AMP-forming)/AMP-acid ligase II
MPTDNLNLVESMLANAATRPDAVAIAQGDLTWTFDRFASDVRRLSAGFLAQHIRPGDRVVLHLGNCIPAMIACYAGMAIGAIVVPLDISLTTAETERMLHKLRPSLYLGHADRYDRINDCEQSVLPAERRFTVDGIEGDGRGRSWLELLSYEDSKTLSVFQDPEAHAILITTSGATGEPKLVVHTQGSLRHTVSLAGALGWNRNVKSLCHAPLYRPLGYFALIVCMTLGISCVLPECREFSAGPVLDAIERHRCSRVAGTPLHVSELIKTQREQPRQVDSLSFCTVFGDSAPVELYDDFKRVFKLPLRNLIAMAEAIGCLCHGVNHQSVRIVPGLARLVDEDGALTPEGDVGELIVRGPSVFKGYWKSPGVVDDPKRDGWYYTGDMMRQTDSGELRYEIRRSDVIVRAGEHLSPLEIARALQTHPAVADAAVTGVPDVFWGQRVVGLVELVDPSKPCDVYEILGSAALQLADHKVPEALLVVDRIPRNSVGKLSRQVVAAIAARHLLDV